MLSIDAGTSAEGDGRPAAEPEPRRGLRDRPLGRMLLLAVVLVTALVLARTCGSANQEISQEEAIAIAKERASFEPCPQAACLQVRYLQRGIPPRAFWAIVLGRDLGPDNRPRRIESFLINVQTGAVSKP
jgi:hypothetical protein